MPDDRIGTNERRTKSWVFARRTGVIICFRFEAWRCAPGGGGALSRSRVRLGHLVDLPSPCSPAKCLRLFVRCARDLADVVVTFVSPLTISVKAFAVRSRCGAVLHLRDEVSMSSVVSFAAFALRGRDSDFVATTANPFPARARAASTAA